MRREINRPKVVFRKGVWRASHDESHESPHRIMMDLTENKLRYFVSVAAHQSISKAAQEFYISQTAITQQIRSLEEQLQISLFDRSTRPISLTPAGAVFLKEAKAIIERMDNAVSRTKDASAGMTGRLTVGYGKGLERSNLSNILREFHRQYPNIFVTCVRSSSDILSNELKNGTADLIFSWDSTNLCQSEEVSHRLFKRARLVVVLYPSHPFAQRKFLQRKDLKGEPLLYMSLASRSDSIRDAHFLELYKKAGFTPDIVAESSDPESILMMVATEEGITILPDYMTEKLDNADNLLFIPLLGEEEYEDIDAIWMNSNANPALESFLRFRNNQE